MNPENTSQEVLRVTRTKDEAKISYDKMSSSYDFFAGSFENRYKTIALEQLNLAVGESVLEVGFGTGYCLQKMAAQVGEYGKVYGIDLSSGMVKVARRRLEKVGLLDRIQLDCGDAVKLPYEDNKFDEVFSSFSLELFDTPEIPVVIAEMKRVLKPDGRIGIISMCKEDHANLMVRAYEWCHVHFPKYADCRPIRVESAIQQAGFEIKHTEKINMMGLPAQIVIALNN